MFNKKTSMIAALLACALLCGSLASCAGDKSGDDTSDALPDTVESSAETSSETYVTEIETDETSEIAESEESSETVTGSESEETSETAESKESEENSETVTERPYDETVEINYSGSDADIVELGNTLSNKVQSYYNDGDKGLFVMENANTVINYNMSNDIYVRSITDKNGNTYIENTMDVFVKMMDGSKYYASESIMSPSMNIYRLGYYYYENRIENQTFAGGEIVDFVNIKHYGIDKTKNIEQVSIDKETKNTTFRITDKRDPQMYLPNVSYDSDKYSYIELTMKANDGIREEMELYVWAGSYEHYSSEQKINYNITVDGEYHTYIIPLAAVPDYTGTVKGIRLDVNGEAGSTFEISGIRAISFGDETPQNLSMQRSFLTYSDKVHHVTQISASKKTENISEIVNEIKIPVSRVSSLIIKDGKGWHYYVKDKIAKNSVQYVGLLLDGVGVFGIILPADDSDDSARVYIDESGEYYVLEISKTPANWTLEPSLKGTGNSNDLFMGFRIYTDSESTFDKFLYEAECEVNPLGEENFIIDAKKSGSASFAGYDTLRGYYKFNIDLAGGFNGPFYSYPNRHFGVRFTAVGDDKNRTCYVVGYTADGALECSAILDEGYMLMPVPVQVGKNFKGDGENTIFNIDDFAYGESLVPFSIPANSSETYSMLHLYQNWGNFPLKQLSSIQFFSPYYHISVGTTETNCIVPFDRNGLALTDFRANSAPFWDNQPQHNSCGSHSFALYTNENGDKVIPLHKSSYIDSHGPTYMEMTDYFESSDGSYKFTYNHMELPQIDENRTFYQIKIEFCEDVSFESFKNSFEIYKLKSADPTGRYQKVGYLDRDNVCSVADANMEKGSVKEYILGDECPYFTFFYMDDPTATGVQGYSNPAFLVYQSKLTVGGAEQNASFLLKDDAEYLTLTLNLDSVEFKAGDEIVIDGILLPWGSQELDPPENEDERDSDKVYYDTVIDEATGELYMDKNVRDVRADSLLNPMTLTALENCEIVESVFLPRARTTDGKSAEFSVKGGANNIAVRVYGFETLTVPTVEEYTDGEWRIVELCSASKPDKQGYGYLYDGYSVYRDADGTYSYAFTFDIGEGEERRFRITAEGEFGGFDEKDPFESLPLNVYISADNITAVGASFSSIYGVGKNENMVGEGYFRFYGNGKAKEAYLTPFKESSLYPTTGQYAVIKYRIPTTNTCEFYGFDVFSSTTLTAPVGSGDYYNSRRTVIADGEWHVLVIDLSCIESFTPEEDGSFRAKYIRFDIMNCSAPIPETDYIDIAYFGISDSLEDICALNSDAETVMLSQDNLVKLVNTKTFEITIPESEAVPDTILNMYIGPNELDAGLTFYCNKTLNSKDGYIRYTAKGRGDAFVYAYMDSTAPIAAGQYAVLKYRIPSDSVGTLTSFELFASTTANEAQAGSNIRAGGIVADGEWHIMIVDLSGLETYTRGDDGNYNPKHLRIDVIDQKNESTFFIDFAFVAMHDDLDEIIASCNENDHITLVNTDASYKVIEK